MKRYAIHVILFFYISLSAFSQTGILEKKITLQEENLSLPKILKKISEEYQVHFSYSTRLVNKNQHLSINAKDVPLKEVLDELFKNLSLTYIIVEDQIVIKHDKKKKGKDDPVAETYTISGYIKDKNTGEVLIGATAYIQELTSGTMANPYGFYSLTLPKGQYDITYSFIGYKKVTENLQLTRDISQSIFLEEDTSSLKEVVIRRDEMEVMLDRGKLSEVNINPKEIEKIPSFVGEADVIKSLQSIPGIKFFGEGSTLFYVRGGNKDQNLILIDEAPVYNPSHLLGFFSSFVPYAVQDVKVYKGDFPAQYGGRLSSLVDIKTKEGNMKRLGFYANIGLISTGIALDGPLKKDKSSFFISGRRSHLRWLYKEQDTNVEKLYFSDLNAKFNFRLNERNRLFFSLYAGKDFYKIAADNDAFGINWENVAGTIRWNHLFSQKLFSNTTLYASRYDYFLVSSFNHDIKWNSHIANASLKSDFVYFPKPGKTHRFGIKLSAHNFNPGNMDLDSTENTVDYPVVPQKNATETVLYYNNEEKITKKLSYNLGLRLSLWQNIGETTEYFYDDDHTLISERTYAKDEPYYRYSHLEPRISLSYRLAPNASIKSSYARTVQYIHLLTNSISPFTSLEVWWPSGPNVQPQVANQWATGYFQWFPNAQIQFQIEAFYKKFLHQIDYTDHADLYLNPHIEAELRTGDAWAYGIELLVKKEKGRLGGWLAYTYSRSLKKIPEISKNSFPSVYDRPHDVSLYLRYELSKRTDISARWMFYTGPPFSSPTSFFYANGQMLPIYTEKNNRRMPDYHRLDISMQFQLNKPQAKTEHKLSVSLFNAYGKENPFAFNFNKIETAEGEIKVPSDFIQVPQYVATKTYLYKATPSITYTFKY